VLFHVGYGSEGGSWLQEGAAVFVQERWAGRSAAKAFCEKYPARRRAPLAELMRLPQLLVANQILSERNYAQAGALFEYLRQRHADAIPKLAKMDPPARRGLYVVKSALGRSVAKFEASWKQWLQQHEK
jgi:hypothetical protein